MPSQQVIALKRALLTCASPARAKVNASFFKTGPGEYGEGDVFMGVSVPDTRRVVRQLGTLAISDIKALLADPIHEVRLAGLLSLVDLYDTSTSPQDKRRVCANYLSLRSRINNWDLVDTSAPYILGAETWRAGSIAPLLRLAKSKRHWDRRIAMIATLAWTRSGDVDPAMRLARLFLSDPEDLMHKASGWMLREAGKKDLGALRQFLATHGRKMPRTMLRYAIERLPEAERKGILNRTRN